jgi:hypothetical protein
LLLVFVLQDALKGSLAKVAGVSRDRVTIETITEAMRRLLAKGIRVGVSIEAKDTAEAETMVGKFTEDRYVVYWGMDCMMTEGAL